MPSRPSTAPSLRSILLAQQSALVVAWLPFGGYRLPPSDVAAATLTAAESGGD